MTIDSCSCESRKQSVPANLRRCFPGLCEGGWIYWRGSLCIGLSWNRAVRTSDPRVVSVVLSLRSSQPASCLLPVVPSAKALFSHPIYCELRLTCMTFTSWFEIPLWGAVLLDEGIWLILAIRRDYAVFIPRLFNSAGVDLIVVCHTLLTFVTQIF